MRDRNWTGFVGEAFALVVFALVAAFVVSLGVIALISIWRAAL